MVGSIINSPDVGDVLIVIIISEYPFILLFDVDAAVNINVYVLPDSNISLFITKLVDVNDFEFIILFSVKSNSLHDHNKL